MDLYPRPEYPGTNYASSLLRPVVGDTFGGPLGGSQPGHVYLARPCGVSSLCWRSFGSSSLGWAYVRIPVRLHSRGVRDWESESNTTLYEVLLVNSSKPVGAFPNLPSRRIMALELVQFTIATDRKYSSFSAG